MSYFGHCGKSGLRGTRSRGTRAVTQASFRYHETLDKTPARIGGWPYGGYRGAVRQGKHDVNRLCALSHIVGSVLSLVLVHWHDAEADARDDAPWTPDRQVLLPKGAGANIG